MPGVRVYQLAKELKVQSALIVELLDRLGKEVHSDLSSIDDMTASLVRERLTVALAVETKRIRDEKRTEDDTAAVAPQAESAGAPAALLMEPEPESRAEAPSIEEPAAEVPAAVDNVANVALATAPAAMDR